MKYIDAEEITPIMAEYVADVFSRKEHLDNISYGYCMEIADVFRRYAERAERDQPSKTMNKIDAIKAVLEKRADILRELLKRTNLSPMERVHYQGKKDGYEQAIDLLGESLESITIEL